MKENNIFIEASISDFSICGFETITNNNISEL